MPGEFDKVVAIESPLLDSPFSLFFECFRLARARTIMEEESLTSSSGDPFRTAPIGSPCPTLSDTHIGGPFDHEDIALKHST